MIKTHLKVKHKKDDLALIQGWVPKDLLKEVRSHKKSFRWTWDELLTAFLKDFLNEFKKETENEKD